MGFGPNVSWWWMTLVWSFGGALYDENLNPVVNSKEAVAATDYLKKLLEVSPKGAITATGDDTTSKFLGEDINSNLSKGIFNSNSWDYVLNIWNIRHLHTSESVVVEKSAMSKNRSDYLLFFV
mgnify:CR=1 FL=1